MSSPAGPRIEVPEALVASHRTSFGETGRAWIDALPDLAGRPPGPLAAAARRSSNLRRLGIVLPVVLPDATPAVLKLQPVTDHTVERTRRTAHVERTRRRTPAGPRPRVGFDAARTPRRHRPLATVSDDLAALEILSELLARLSSVPAPAGMRRLSDFGTDLLDRVPRVLTLVREPAQHRLIRACASALEEVLSEAGDRLVHEDLHFDNILAPHPADQREPWLAIDPNPVAGDPGFALLVALHNRWEEAVTTGDVPRAIRRRFDLMTDILGLDRNRAAAWTLARILQNALWDVEHDATMWHTEPDRAIALTLLDTTG